MNRREWMRILGIGAVLGVLPKRLKALPLDPPDGPNKTIVLSTWYNQSLTANEAAWNILKKQGSAIDAVEAGVQVSENDPNNCCVGLGANPDREGHVTLDASIMNHQYGIGAVAALERIQSPIHTARMVMEKTPHVMLVGQGAQQFALEQGQALMPNTLSPHAQKAYDNYLQSKNLLYQPKINIEKSSPSNHDTIGMIALDIQGNLSGACTTSGMAFKMRGRVGDSPIIGAGLYVDNAIGAATATGHGEEIIRSCGSFLVVEFMRQGMHPQAACKKAVERITQITPRALKDIQVGFIAINKKGEHGGYALQKGFDYGVTTYENGLQKIDSEYHLKA